MLFFDFSLLCHFYIFYDIPEVREVSRNLPGARGFAVSEYGPVASHGDPIQPQNYTFSEFPNSVVILSGSENYSMAKKSAGSPKNWIM